jgi:iduronate 2-sulfatase
VPFIILAPGANGNGQPCERVIECVDLYPTLCQLCGLQQPAGLEGRSIEPLLENPMAAWDLPAFTVWSETAAPYKGSPLARTNGDTPNSTAAKGARCSSTSRSTRKN